MDRTPRLLIVLVSVVVGALLLSACAGPAPSTPTLAPPPTEEPEEEMHEHEHEEHAPEEHMEGAHDVPEEAAEVRNPIEADEESVELGRRLYADHCAVCHGETGEGDGPTAASLDPAPADLHEDHVQDLSDGALFYIVSHGRPESAMPAWEGTLTEEERWHVVNFMRTFQEE